MTAGAAPSYGGRPAPSQKRGAAATTYYTSFYRCPCDAHPFVRMGRVTVEHREWCPVHRMKTR